MKQEWTDKLRERMADYEQPAGDDVWTAIERRLDGGKATKRTLWKRIAVAAAVALVAAGVALETMTDHAADHTNNTATPPTERTLTAEAKPSECIARPSEQPQSDKRATTTPYIYIGRATGEAATTKQPIARADTTPPPPTDATTTAITPDHSCSLTTRSTEETPHESHVAVFRPSKRSRLTATVSTSALTTGNAAWQSPVFMSAARAMMFGDGELPESPIRLTNYHEETNHHRPFSVGITLRYPIAQHWYVESGLCYSRLTSDFTKVLPSYEIKETQRVQYLGVPLRLRHRLWQWQSFALSASAGGQADFCIDIERENDGVALSSKRDRPQFSVSASVAAEYLLGSHVALCLEPTLRLYIDNQSNVQTFFKEQPTQLNLHVGACYTF